MTGDKDYEEDDDDEGSLCGINLISCKATKSLYHRHTYGHGQGDLCGILSASRSHNQADTHLYH